MVLTINDLSVNSSQLWCFYSSRTEKSVQIDLLIIEANSNFSENFGKKWGRSGDRMGLSN